MKTSTTPVVANNGQQNKLTRAQFYRVTELLKTVDVSKIKSMQDLCDLALKELSLSVAQSSMKEALDILELKLPARPAKPASPSALIAAELAKLMKSLGHPVSKELELIAGVPA